MKRFTIYLAAILAAMSMATAQAKDIIIGVPNWDSVRATANILAVAIEENLGLEVELQTSTNPVIFEAMDKGNMHVHPEVWLPNQQNLFDTFVMEKKSVKYNRNAVLSDQHICATAGTAQRLGIKSVSDLTDPKIAAALDRDGDGQGDIWIGTPGWASTKIERIRAKSYGYDQTLDLKEMDETLALAQVANAISANDNIVFYCYTPHHMFTLYDLVVLKEPAYDAGKWVIKQPTDAPNWLENSSAPTAWDATRLHIHYSASLERTHPSVAAMLSSVQLNTSQVNGMVYALSVERMDAKEFAQKWVMEN